MSDAFVDLCATFGLATRAERPSSPPDAIAVIVGFTGAQMRGTLTLTTSLGFLIHTRPSPPQDDVELFDWAAEFGNQLLGRIKNQFLRYGVEIRLTIPLAVSGRAIRLLFDPQTDCRGVLWFSSEVGGAALWADVHFAPNLVEEPCPTEPEPAAEGSMLLF